MPDLCSGGGHVESNRSNNHIPNKNDSLEERLTASAKLNRESASTSQSTSRMVSDLERRLADAEAQGATARRAQVAAEKQVLRLQADLRTAHEQELQSKQTQSALQDKLRRQQHRLDVLNNEKQRGEKRDADSSAVKQNLDQAVFAKLQSTLLVRGYIGEQIPLRAQLQSLFQELAKCKKKIDTMQKDHRDAVVCCLKINLTLNPGTSFFDFDCFVVVLWLFSCVRFWQTFATNV